MPHSKLLSLICTGLVLASTSAFAAAPVTDEGATALQSRFAKEFGSRKDIKVAGMKADFTGAVNVVAKGSYYQTTLPSLKLTDKKNNVVNVGKVVMNMMPTEDADEWKTSVAIPSTIGYQDVAGKNNSQITIGSQQASGIWDMKVFGLRKLDSSYNNIAFKNLSTKEGFSGDTLTVSYDLTKSADGFSGPVDVMAKQLNWVDSNGVTSLLAPSIKVQTKVVADKTAASGYTQTSQAEITGLTNAINVLNNKLQDPKQGSKAQLQKAVGILSILQMSGKPGNGSDTRYFDVATNAQGKTLLNGVDVSLLLTAASIK